MEEKRKQQYRVQLTSHTPDGECVETVAIGVGRVNEKGGILTYREPEETGLGKTETKLTFRDGRLAMERSGETNASFVFLPSVWTDVKMTSGGLGLCARAYTKTAAFLLEEKRATIGFSYVLQYSEEYETELKMEIRIAEVKTAVEFDCEGVE